MHMAQFKDPNFSYRVPTYEFPHIRHIRAVYIPLQLKTVILRVQNLWMTLSLWKKHFCWIIFRIYFS